MSFRTAVWAIVIITSAACSRWEHNTKSPQWIVEQYYAPTGFPGATDYMTDAFARTLVPGKTTVGVTLSSSATVASRAVEEQPTRAVYATMVKDNGQRADWYTYLRHDDHGWRIDAVRSFALPDTVTPVTASDSALKAYLVAHAPVLDSIARAFRRRSVLNTVDATQPVTNPRDATLQQLLVHARADEAFRDERFPHCVFVRLGGVGRTQAGYMYQADGCVVPPMTPDVVVYVERGVDHWYVYKAL